MITPKLSMTDKPFYHLSHTDLDGYGSQYMTRMAGFRARYFNADYKDVTEALRGIVDEIKKGGEDAQLLITDLNLTPGQAKELEKMLAALAVNVEVQLLDHHATGQETAETHDWYHLDTERCATLLTYEACEALFADNIRELMGRRARFVDVGDRWLKDSPDFTRSVYLIGLVMEDDQIAPPLADLKRVFRFHMIDAYFSQLEQGASLEELEMNLHNLRKKFLDGRVEKKILKDPEIPLKEKFHRMSAELLPLDEIPMLSIDGARAGIFFNWNHDVYRGVIMQLMEEQGLMDMAISLRANGRMSLRANPGTDVGLISSKYFSGGGHPGAAGGMLQESRIRSLPHAVKLIREAINQAPASAG